MTLKIRRNVIHTDAQMKEHSTTCVHRYHKGEQKTSVNYLAEIVTMDCGLSRHAL